MAKSSDLLFLGIRTGREFPHLPSVKTALEYPYTEEEEKYLIRKIRRRRVVGTPEQVKERLLRLAEEWTWVRFSSTVRFMTNRRASDRTS